MAKLKITATDSSGQIHDRYTRPTSINSALTGGTGGKTNQTGRQISPQVKVGSNAVASGSILAQKGAHKFRALDTTGATGNSGICTLVNLATPTASNTMSIKMFLANITGVAVAAANVAGGATGATVSWTSGLTGPVKTPRVGDYILGLTGFGNISATAAQVTAVVSSTSVTVAATGNVAAQSGLTASDYTFVSRISNNYVWDWTSDGYQDSTSGSSFYSSGFNPNRFRYHLADVDNTFVMVQYA